MKISRRILIKILLQLLFLFLIVASDMVFSNKMDNQEMFFFWAGLSLRSFFLFVLLNVSGVMTAQWFTVLFLYVYNCGQVWLHLFGIDFSKSSFLITQYAYLDINKALFYFLVIINVFQIFLNFFFKEEDYLKSREGIDIGNNSNLKSTLIVFSVVAFVFVTYNDIVSIIAARTMGYFDSYTIGRNNPIIYMMIYLYPLLTVLWQFLGTERQKKVVMIYSVLRCLVMMLLVGNRGQYIALLILLFLIREKEQFEIKKRLFKQIIVMALLGVVLLLIAGYVSDIRNNISGHIGLVEYLTQGNIFFSMLQELGGTFINSIFVLKLCPGSLPYAGGKSYMAAFVQLIPKGTSLIPTIGKYGNLGSVLNGFFSKGSGLGGSFIAEQFYNFSWFSVLIIPVFSWLLVKLDRFTVSENVSVMKKAVSYYYLYAVFMYVRGEFSDFAVYTRYLLYFLFVYWVINSIGKRRIN